MIGDVLDFSRIEAGLFELNLRPFELEKVVDDSLGFVAAEAARKGIELRREVCCVSGSVFLGDSQRLRQVLINLLGNAVKFTTSGHVDLRLVTSERINGNWNVRFEIADTGVGMEQEFLQRLFRPFCQEDSSNTRKFGGTGLGLSLTKGILDLMGGTILVESERGVGTTFVVEISFQRVPS